jgi:stage II sporulation protein D
MKNFVYYVFIMVVVVILLPLFIVKSCSIEQEDVKIIQETPEQEVKIKVYNSSEGNIMELSLEEYVKGVVAAEMPADFGIEALKAQAVAARTYTYARILKDYNGKEDIHKGADICTDHTHCQAWVSKKEAMEKWDKLHASKNWDRINKAVTETKGLIITYDNTVANPVFHSNSGGRTENAEEVWDGNAVPYLVSVPSKGEEASSSYESTVTVNCEDFKEILRQEYPGIEFNSEDIMDDIEIIDFTVGERVKTIKIGGIEIKGTDFRKLFSLKSTKFEIENTDDGILTITTIGNGHGVGMSQWGANYLAENGGTFEEILNYYYKGISLETIEQFENK